MYVAHTVTVSAQATRDLQQARELQQKLDLSKLDLSKLPTLPALGLLPPGVQVRDSTRVPCNVLGVGVGGCLSCGEQS
jgi:hypothetical protein